MTIKRNWNNRANIDIAYEINEALYFDICISSSGLKNKHANSVF